MRRSLASRVRIAGAQRAFLSSVALSGAGRPRTTTRGPRPAPTSRASSAGAPQNRRPPSASTSTRSAYRSASDSVCVAYTTVLPAPASPSMCSQRRSRWRGSRAELGSSMSSIGGSASRPIATFTRWRLPPERRSTRSFVAVAQPGLLEHPVDRRLDVTGTFEAGEQAQVLGDGQLRVERQRLRHPARPAGSGRDRAGVGRLNPGQDGQQRRLAGPVRPDAGDTLPCARLDRHVVQGLVRAVALVQPDRFEHHGRLRLHSARLTSRIGVAMHFAPSALAPHISCTHAPASCAVHRRHRRRARQGSADRDASLAGRALRARLW